MKSIPYQTILINILLILGVVILPICGIAAYHQIQQLIRANNWVLHTEQVMNLSTTVLLNLTEIEARMNYYIVTDDRSSLGNFLEIINTARKDIQSLKELTKDNVIQKNRVSKLVELAEKKINLLTTLYQINNIDDNPKAMALATSDARKAIKYEIIDAVSVINKEELNLLNQRNNVVLNEIKHSHLIFFIFGGLSELIIILCFFLLNYSLHKQKIAINKQTKTENELLESNKLLQESDERYLLSTEGSSAGLWDWKVGTNQVFYSSYFKKMLGFTEDEFPNTLESFEKAIHPSDHDRLWMAVNDHLENKIPFKTEYRLRTKAGNYNWFEAAGQALWDRSNKPIRMSGSIIDINDRKKAEQRLHIQYAITDILADATDLASASIKIIKQICQTLGWEIGIFWMLDKKNNVLLCTGNWHESMLSLKKFTEEICQIQYKYGEGLPGKVWQSGTPIWISDFNNDELLVENKIIKNNEIYSTFAFPIMIKKQILGIIQCFASEQKNSDHLMLNLLATIGSQLCQFALRKKSENELRKSEAYQSAILQAVPNCIITINHEQNIVSFNSQTMKEFNYTDKELQNKNIELLIPNIDIAEIISTTKTMTGFKKNEETFPIEVKASAMNIDDKLYTIIVVQDITERQKVDKLKNEFVSVVSHELRTPLTSIRGALGLIIGGATGSYTEKTKKLLDLANNNCERLLTLINDILDIEKIEAGKMDFQLKIINLNKLVKDTLEANKIYAQKYQINLVLIEEIENVNVDVDPNRLTQVLTNLLSNAIKFSPTGETVTLTIAPKEQYVRITVVNKGAGIPLEIQPKIFQKFTQADTSDTRNKGGTGLGLSISKAILEKFKSTLKFVSEPNVETNFYFDLPIYMEFAENYEKQADKILICEDDEEQANYISELLQSYGFTTDVTSTVEEAKDLLQHNHYQVMLLDLLLPDQDGISFLRELKNDKQTENLSIIVLSVIAQTGKKMINDEGFMVKDWLDKPIDFDKLMHLLNKIKDKNYPKKPLILHVEDDPITSEIIKSLLEEQGEVISATTINETKEKLQNHTFDLLILDLLLPDGNAEELLPLISKYKIPVIIYSSQELHKTLPKIVKHVVLKSANSNEKLLNVVKHVLQAIHAKEMDNA